MPYASLDELPTPCLLIDWSTARANIAHASASVAGGAATLRPHFKNHKCVRIAQEQVAAPKTVGMCTATVDETAALVEGGIDDVLLANLVVDPIGVRRLAQLARAASLRVAVEDDLNARALSAAAVEAGSEIGVLVEIEIGLGRCGLAPGPAAVALVERIMASPGLRFDGLQAYHGSAGQFTDSAARADYARRTMQIAVDFRAELAARGIDCAIVSGGGTSTYAALAGMAGVDELQIGSYVTMDWFHRESLSPEFDLALSVLTTVVSVHGDRVVMNVGAKGLGSEFGAPRVQGYPSAEIARPTIEEHTVAEIPGHTLRRGDRVRLLPSHCCGTCNLYRQMVLHDGETVLSVEPIVATGYALT